MIKKITSRRETVLTLIINMHTNKQTGQNNNKTF